MSTYESVDFYAIDDLLSPEEIQVRTRVREWVERRALPLVRRYYDEATFPLELVPEMGELGALGGTLHGYGCAGMSNLQYGLLLQELERADSGLRTMASVQGALAMNAIYLFGTEEQKQAWLPQMAKGKKIGCFGLTEPEFGSNPGGMLSRARKTATGYVLNGSKMWIGSGSIADVAIIWAKVEGEPGVDSNSASAVRGFLVDPRTPGFSAEVITGKLSMRMGITCRLKFKDCALPASALLPLSKGLKSPLQCLNHARYGIAWGVVGAAIACYEEARQYAAQRIQFGKPIGSFQLVQRKLALMLTEITKAQLLCLRLAQLKDAKKITHVQISLAKRNNVAMALDIARSTRDLLGGVGILDEYQSFRHMCNLESVKTYEGTDDMHLLIMGEEITGISAFS